MKRGGTFPRWRWRPDRPLADRLGAFVLRSGRSKATVQEWPRGWWATFLTLATDENGLVYWQGQSMVPHFSRRCDAKRWCERMLSEASS